MRRREKQINPKGDKKERGKKRNLKRDEQVES
jgi:hypothetical protein